MNTCGDQRLRGARLAVEPGDPLNRTRRKSIWSGYEDSDAIRAAGFEHLTTMGMLQIDGDVIADYRVWFDTGDPLTTLYVDESEQAYLHSPAALEPETKHAWTDHLEGGQRLQGKVRVTWRHSLFPIFRRMCGITRS
jgi:hypothetical protein